MNEGWENEELLVINVPGLPDALRDHGKLFRNPARYVIDVGDSVFVLYAEDGELLDIAHVTEQ